MTLSAVIASAFLLPQSSQACTNLIVGKNASVDGSVIVSYAADSHTPVSYTHLTLPTILLV